MFHGTALLTRMKKGFLKCGNEFKGFELNCRGCRHNCYLYFDSLFTTTDSTLKYFFTLWNGIQVAPVIRGLNYFWTRKHGKATNSEEKTQFQPNVSLNCRFWSQFLRRENKRNQYSIFLSMRSLQLKGQFIFLSVYQFYEFMNPEARTNIFVLDVQNDKVTDILSALPNQKRHCKLSHFVQHLKSITVCFISLKQSLSFLLSLCFNFSNDNLIFSKL